MGVATQVSSEDSAGSSRARRARGEGRRGGEEKEGVTRLSVWIRSFYSMHCNRSFFFSVNELLNAERADAGALISSPMACPPF